MRPARLWKAWECAVQRTWQDASTTPRGSSVYFLWRSRLGQEVSRRNPGAYKEASFQGIWRVTYFSWKAEGVRSHTFTRHVLTSFC